MGKETLTAAQQTQLNLQELIKTQTTKAMEQAAQNNYLGALAFLDEAKQAYDKQFQAARDSRKESTGALGRRFGSLKSPAESEARDSEKETKRQYEALLKLMGDFQSKLSSNPMDPTAASARKHGFEINVDAPDVSPATANLVTPDASQQPEHSDRVDNTSSGDAIVAASHSNDEATTRLADPQVQTALLAAVESAAVFLQDLESKEAKHIADQETAKRIAEQEAARLQAEETARLQAEEAARLQAEEAARLQAEEAARLQAEETARLQAEEAARLQAEETARLQAEEDVRLQAEEMARLQAEEDARLQAEEDARLQAEETARLQAEETARLQAEETARLQAEEAARLQAEEAARLQAEEAARLQAEEAARLAAEQVNNPENPFDTAIKQLKALVPHADLKRHYDAFMNQLTQLKESKKGPSITPALIEALEATHTLLTSEKPDFKAYQKVADKMQGSPNPGLHALGAIMILLGAAAALLAASGFGLIIVATAAAISASSFAGAGVSFFGASRTGLSSEMTQLSDKFKHIPEEQRQPAILA